MLLSVFSDSQFAIIVSVADEPEALPWSDAVHVGRWSDGSIQGCNVCETEVDCAEPLGVGSRCELECDGTRLSSGGRDHRR